MIPGCRGLCRGDDCDHADEGNCGRARCWNDFGSVVHIRLTSDATKSFKPQKHVFPTFLATKVLPVVGKLDWRWQLPPPGI
jgi:hypothetical protein